MTSPAYCAVNVPMATPSIFIPNPYTRRRLTAMFTIFCVMAVNTLLMQLFTLFSYIMDGFAYAGEALAGRYIGANNQKALHKTVRQLFGWGVGLSLAFTLLYSIGGQSFLGLLTDETTVIHASVEFY